MTCTIETGGQRGLAETVDPTGSGGHESDVHDYLPPEPEYVIGLETDG